MSAIHTPRQLAECILGGLEDRPSDPCLHYEDTVYTGPELSRLTRALARRLGRAGVSAGMRVALALRDRADLLMAMLALWLNNATYTPLDPSQPHPRLLRCLNNSRIERLIIAAEDLSLWHDSPCPLLLWPHSILTAADNLGTEVAGGDDETEAYPLDSRPPGAYLLHSSGTLGEAKGIVVSAPSLLALLSAIQQRLPLPEPLRVLSHNHPCFDITLLEWLLPLIQPGCLILLSAESARDPDTVRARIETTGATLLQATPSRWQQWLDRGQMPAVSMCLSGGEALPRPLASRLLSLSPQVWNLYGPTETCIWASAHPVTARDCLPAAPSTVSIGRPLPGYAFIATAEDELLISGTGLALSSGGQPLATVLINGLPWYATGDQARLTDEGNWHWLGRKDLQIKHLGVRLHPGDIESLLSSHPCLDAAVVIKALDTHGFSQLVAIVVHKRAVPNKNRQALNRFLKRELPDNMLPQRYLFLPELPLLANGKVDRKALGMLVESAMQTTRSAQASTNEAALTASPKDLAAVVRHCFSHLLGVSQFSDWDSFFDLGGHSMLVASLQLMLEQALDCRLSLRVLLSQPPTVHSTVICLHHALAGTSSDDKGSSG